MVRPAARRLRVPSMPARIAIVVGVILLLLIKWRMTPRVTFSESELESIWSAPRDDVADKYARRRETLLSYENYEPHAAAKALRAPPWVAEGYPTLDDRVEIYAGRLGNFVTSHLGKAAASRALEHAVGRVLKNVPPTIATFPRKLFSTDPFGDAGVPDMFRLWSALLPLPLGGGLEDLLPQTEWAEAARTGAPWEAMVADWSVVVHQLERWTGNSLVKGSGDWATLWQKLGSGSHRSNVFKYMALLFEGGAFASSDTIPIAHPYLWGLDAKSALHPDLELIKGVLVKHASSSDATHRRLWERDTQGNWSAPMDVWGEVPEALYTLDPRRENNNTTGTNDVLPPDHNIPLRHRHRRGLWQAAQPDEKTSILSPEINLVVAIDWDASIAFAPSRWQRWSLSRLRRSLFSAPGRTLQFSNNIIMAKPYHPVFLDTVATIWGSVESGGIAKLDPVDLSGAGPFSDAVLRYLLARYGVTPRHLRNLSGPIRIGDVLILQEEALLAPVSAVADMLAYVQRFFPTLPGSGVAQAVPGETLWCWGTGFSAWWSGGRRVANRGQWTAVDVAADQF